MSLLINNELIWISIPRCASTTTESILINSELNIKKYSLLIKNEDKHYHIKKSHLYDEFGIKETICITRNWFDRWMSALQYFFDGTKYIHNLETIINYEDIDNEFVYKNFDYDFTNLLNNGYVDETTKWQNWETIYSKLVKTDNLEFSGHISMFLSEKYWKENEYCTYEFDIKNIHFFYDFLSKKYNVKFKNIEKKENKNRETKSKIIVNDEFKNFIWDRFEKPFIKSKLL